MREGKDGKEKTCVPGETVKLLRNRRLFVSAPGGAETVRRDVFVMSYDVLEIFCDLFYYVGNIVCDISGITRKSTAENPIGAADFLKERSLLWRPSAGRKFQRPGCPDYLL